MLEFLTLDEVSHILKIGRSKVYELANRPDFPTVRIGRNIRVPKDALIQWVESQYLVDTNQ